MVELSKRRTRYDYQQKEKSWKYYQKRKENMVELSKRRTS